MRVDTYKVRDKQMRDSRAFEYTRGKSRLSRIRLEATECEAHRYFAASRYARGVTPVTDLNIFVKWLWLW